jgi:hypothetical protein
MAYLCEIKQIKRNAAYERYALKNKWKMIDILIHGQNNKY